MNSKIWTTMKGERICIKDMTNTHLINTIHYLRRIGWVAREETIGRAYAGNTFNPETIASYYADQDIMLMEQETLCDFLLRTIPQYQELLLEVEKRELKLVDKYDKQSQLSY